MFTGIIESTGRVTELHAAENGARICIDAGTIALRMKSGDSIAVDGICLTVVRRKGKRLWIDVSAETWSCTNLAHRTTGSVLNLEAPLTANSMMSGHFVQGHVEGVGRVRKWIHKGEDVRIFVQLPASLVPFCVPKGSIAINGVSLTIASQKGNTIGIALIPYTLRHTNLSRLQPGDLVNVETDMIGRYVVSTLKMRGG